MIDGMLVVDAIVHSFDCSEENIQDNPIARAAHELIWASTDGAFPPERIVPRSIGVGDRHRRSVAVRVLRHGWDGCFQ